MPQFSCQSARPHVKAIISPLFGSANGNLPLIKKYANSGGMGRYDHYANLDLDGFGFAFGWTILTAGYNRDNVLKILLTSSQLSYIRSSTYQKVECKHMRLQTYVEGRKYGISVFLSKGGIIRQSTCPHV